ncbi:MAG TPA: carboxypeptidase regulatory-like domain-containing protein [Anaerolineales bacterium]|nr:carboxypeptidase regulatory-like domain-containing protein [Anaerolineales bacterium]
MMKLKSVLQVLIAAVVVFGAMGGAHAVLAQTDEPVVVVRDLTYWDATYTGYVDENRHEKWPVVFTQAEDFKVTASPTGAGLTTLIRLLDESGSEIASSSGMLISSQPAGNYFVMVEPETGSGFYDLTIRREEVTSTDPSSATTADPGSVKVGESSVVSVSLANVPAEGYTSAEFTCTYDAAVVEVSNIVVTDLFGADSAAAINGPANGSFIVAVAGSNGNRATTDGTVFTFNATGLQVGETTITCVARVSQGDNVLTEVPSTSATLTVVDTTTDVEICDDGIDNDGDGLVDSDDPDCQIAGDSTLTGQVLAGKTVTVSLYDDTDALVTSVTAESDGTFSVMAPAGTYKVVATAAGFLSAEASATLTADATTTLSAVTLLAGDIDGNNVIDQFDAMTIGMSYNASDPAAADLNNDGVINVLDLELLAANYRLTGPIVWP